MRTLLKKTWDNGHNALMYGAGHGGFEAFYLLIFGMINNLLYSLMLNSGTAEAAVSQLDAAGQAAMQQVFTTLASTPSYMFLAAPIERSAALIGQIALAV